MFLFSRSKLPTLIRSATALSLLLVFCALTLPLSVPLPVPPPTDKDLSEPFPCQHRPCGCQSAEQCWKSCCCYTNQQKVAWARAHQVAIPDYVVAAASKEAQQAAQQVTVAATARPGNSAAPQRPDAVRGCCAQHGTCAAHGHCEQPASCDRQQASVARTSVVNASVAEASGSVGAESAAPGCCSHSRTQSPAATSTGLREVGRAPETNNATCCDASDMAEERTARAPQSSDIRRTRTSKSKWVLAVYAAECQGQGTWWLSLAWTAVPDPVAVCMAPAEVTEWLLILSERLPNVQRQTPLPPPRLA